MTEAGESTALLRSGPSWLPGAAARLSRPKWREARSIGFDETSYGSERWLLRRPDAERPGTRLRIADGRWSPFFEEPVGSVLARARELRLVFGSPPLSSALDLLREADELMTAAPELRAAVHALVRTVHVLSAEPCYDVSHSDPSLPFSVFVSLPLGEANAAERLAESLVHEAMHLQLTLVDEAWPLTIGHEVVGYSPWQRCDRPLLGLVHGLYVFVAIERLHRGLLADGDEPRRAFSSRRLDEIADEIASVASLRDSPGLTEIGRDVVEVLFSDHAALAATKSIAIEL